MSEQPDHGRREHSPLGASGAERWMNCPGSVSLLRELQLPESDEPDYRREGTAMHEAAEHCLRNGIDTWEIVGISFNDTVIDAPMADAIQVYLDDVRPDMEVASWHQVEYRVSSPVHKDFYGAADFAAVIAAKNRLYMADVGKNFGEKLKIKDLKGGEGIVVDPEDNPQMKYYAFGVIDEMERGGAYTLRDDLEVELTIVQPRAFHQEGPIRSWSTTVGEIKLWVHTVLVPAMNNAEFDQTLDAGPWCRFCPAKLVCPLLTSLFRAACVSNPKEVINYSLESLGRSWQYARAVKFYLKALEDETYRRLNNGDTMEGMAKLVPKKANRVWKPEAAPKAKALFGEEAVTKPELKSPAELEKIGPKAKEFAKEYAYMPSTGHTVAAWDDPKPGIKVQTTNQAFGDAVAALGVTEDAA